MTKGIRVMFSKRVKIMTLAMLSAISLICMDAAMAARPVDENMAIVEVAAMSAQATPETVESALVSAPAENTADSGDVFLALEDQYPENLVFDGESDEVVAERLLGYIENLDTLSADFTQIAPSGAISTGKLSLRRPGFLRFEYDPPTPLLIVANGGLVYVRDEALETTDSYPVGKTPLKLLLKKNIDRDDAKIIAVDRGVDTIAVTFGSNVEETEGELTIIASAPDMALERWIVRDLQNGITVVTLENVETGIRLANRLFQVPEAGGQFLKN
ncbi:MAG: outer membrane lipoprotein carrier protein LolA [Marinicaulis sp.]|nr:outer membrane lipoprotein carrier protein LolA [Marinicaulis sp.]